MQEIINILDKIIISGAVTDCINNFYTIDEKVMLALRELLKREQSEIEKLKNEVYPTPQNL